MRARSSVAAALLALTALAATSVACAPDAAEDDEHDHAGEAISTKNMGRTDFGLKRGELLLTLDDGPGTRTKELVDYFVEKQVPAVFFMVGRNAAGNLDAVKHVAKRSHEVAGGLIIGNHSFTHTTPLPKQGVDGTVSEIMKTDEVIAPYIAESQKQFAYPVSFFRPPYGAFTALGESNIAKVNERGGSKYVGPIFWEIGGELANGFSADWACWGKVDIPTCQAGYVREAKARGQGIILVHDVHNRTVDMLMGGPGRKGLIEELRDEGFTFVGLREHDDAIQRLAGRPATETQNILAQVFPKEGGKVDITSEAYGGAALLHVALDNGDARTLRVGHQGGNPSGTLTFDAGPGQHVFHLVAVDDRGAELVRKELSFVVAADLGAGDGAKSEGSAPCVNYGRLTVGRQFDLFHKKVDCSAPNAKRTPVEGECYAYKGIATAARNAQATGGNEWSVEYDLSYEGHPEDKSKLHAILETGTGDILTGKRAFPEGSGRKDYTFDESRVDCTEGIWRGNFILPNGSLEAFRFSKPGE